MANTDLEISSLSYTSKDFGTMYPEVLDLANQLTNKWDPSQSNESDPGVVLLKEAAFVADHNNYNIDKNILENFLPSATQDRSVRNITEMNGYTPRYYVAATGDVSFTFRIPEEESESYSEYLADGFSIPKFSIVVTDENNTIAYTQIEDLVIPSAYTTTKSTLGYSGTELQSSSTMFIEGTLQTVTVNGSSTITLSNLDDNNRLYLPETMVAQNGIYIENVNISDYNDYWTRNNFLLTLPTGTHAYKVDYDSLQCLPYIEFPSDISNLIGDGLIVKYISTSGANGNVSAKTLTKISSPTSIKLNIGINNVDVYMSDFTGISNTSSIINGKDPETIDEMYKSFKKFIGTFDTLVTPNDYTNCIYNAEDEYGNPLISNGFVTDRRNDYNKALNVLTHDHNGDYFENISIKNCTLNFKGSGNSLPESAVEGDLFYLNAGKNSNLYVYKNKNTKWISAKTINLNDFAILTKAMTPYDLTLYGLSVLGSYNSSKPELALNNSFTPITSGTNSITERLKTEYIEDYKCLSHTYKDADIGDSNDPASGDVYSFKVLTPIKVTIYPYSKVSEAERDSIVENIHKAITNSYNPRNIEFGESIDILKVKDTIISADSRIKTVDVSFISKSLKALKKISDKTSKDFEVIPSPETNTTLIYQLVAKNVLAGRVCLFDFYDDFDFDFGQIYGEIENYSSNNAITTSLNLPLKKNSSSTVTLSNTTMNVNRFVIESLKLSSGKFNLRYKLVASQGDIEPGSSKKLLSIGDKLIIESTDENNEKIEREYIVSDKDVNYVIKNDLKDTTLINSNSFIKIENTGYITIEEQQIISDTGSTDVYLDYTLKDNEVIQIISPNYYSENSYSNYVYYRYIYTGLDTDKVILSNTEHKLTANETIVLMYNKEGVEQTVILSEGTIIRTSFNLSPTISGTNKDWVDQNGVLNNSPFKQLSASQTIDTRVMMTTELTSTNVNCYWIVDNISNKLFDNSDTPNIKILGTNEYFIYANSALTEFSILGAGTKLEKAALDTNPWEYSSDKVTIETISTEGASSLNNFWISQSFSDELPFKITEMNVITLSSGSNIVITNCESLSGYSDPAKWALDNNWRTIAATISYKVDSSQVVLQNISDFYKIRSRLDLVCSKSSPQKMNSTKQTLTINGNTYKCRIKDNLPVPLYIQSSIPTSLIGNNNMYPVENTNFYIYELEKMPSTTTAIGLTSEGGSVEYSFTVLDVNKQYIIPVYLSNDKVDVYVEMSDTTPRNYVIHDYNNGVLQKSSDGKYILKGLTPYFLTFVPIENKKKITIKFSWTGTTTENENLYVKWKYSIINGLKIESTIINDGGINKYLKNSKLTISNILSTMNSLISNSDKPSVKYNYAYELDNSIAINLDKYNYKEGDSIVGPFANPEIMWDINNVANHMSIQQVDIANSDIDIETSMRNY